MFSLTNISKLKSYQARPDLFHQVAVIYLTRSIMREPR